MNSTVTITPRISTPLLPHPLLQVVVNGLEAIKPLLVTGFPDLGIPPLDPLGPVGNLPFHVDTAGVRWAGDGEVGTFVYQFYTKMIKSFHWN